VANPIASSRGDPKPRGNRGGAAMIGPAFESVLVMARGGDEQAFATLWRDLNPAVVR
jgi:hypothetical protein